jgi:hypothetical protein
MSDPAGVIDVYAYLERLVHRFRPIDREDRKEFLHRERMCGTYALDRSDQEFSVGLDPKPDEAGNIGGLLSHGHRPHKSCFGIDHRAA